MYDRFALNQLSELLQDPRVKLDTSMLFDRETEELNNVPTFEEFLRYIMLELEDNSNDDPHWRSYK